MKIFTDEFKNYLKSFICKFKGHIASDWMEEQWAPGHSTGRKVKVCLRCNKNMDSTPTGKINFEYGEITTTYTYEKDKDMA